MKTLSIPITRASLTASAAHHARRFSRLLAGAAALGSGSAHAVTWGGPGTDWNVGTNWIGGVVPSGTFARIDIASPPATISANLVATPTFIMVGNGTTSNGRVNHVAGTATMAAGNDLQIARGGGTAAYNLANTAATGGALTGFAPGSGTMNAPRHVYVGGFTSGAASTGTLNVHTSGTLAVGSQLLVGTSGGTGTVNIDSGTVTVVDAIEVGNGPGTTGTLNLGGGTITKSSNATAVTIGGGLVSPGGNGTANLTGGSFTSAGVFRVGQGNGSTGVLNLNGANLTVNGEFWVGNNTGATGTMQFSSGTLTTNNWALVGRKDDANAGVGASGEVTMTGGTWTKTGDGNLVIGDTGDGVMTMTGGQVVVVSSPALDGGVTWIGNRNACSGTLSLSGAADFSSPSFVLALEAGTTGTMNLDGGTLRTSGIVGGSGDGSVRFNGTQIIATGDSDAFLDALVSAEVDSGGLLVDTAGFNVSGTQAISGTGDVVKTGAGTLTLGGLNTHVGLYTVTGGTLSLSADSDPGGTVNVADGAGLGVVQNFEFATWSPADVTMGTGGVTSMSIDLGNSFGNPTVPPLDVTGTLTLNGPVTVNIDDQAPALGSIPLIAYNNKSGGGNFVLGTLPLGVSGTLSDDGQGLVSFEVTDISFPVWDGTLNGNWDTTTENWVDQITSDPIAYADPLPVIFNDTAFGTTDIILNQTVSPGSMTFSAFGLAYTINGTGSIAGSTGLAKPGTGDLTVNTANSFTGPVVLSGGTVSIGNETALGVGTSPVVLNGSFLNYTGPDGVMNRGLSLNVSGTLITTENDLTFTGPITSPNGSLVKEGPGNLIFSHDGDNFLGSAGNGVLVHDGTLTLSGGGAYSVAGEMWVADLPNRPANLVLDDTSLTTGSWLAIGRGNGNDGVVNLTATDSTITTVNYSTGFDNGLANNQSEAFVTLNDTVWNNNGLTYLAESEGSTAVMTLNGASQYNINNNLLLARFGSTSNATLTVTGSSSVNKTATGYLAIGNNGVATLNVRDDGSFVSAGGDFNVGDVGTSQGFVNLEDNGTISSVGTIFIGKNAGTQGTFNMSGGTLNASGWLIVGRFNAGTGVFNMNGGVINQTGAGQGVIIGEEGTGTFNMNAGTMNIGGGGLYLTAQTTGTGNATFHLNGGTVVAKQVTERDNTLGTSFFRFNGGTLKAAAGANPTFISNLNTVEIGPGGAIIDTSGQNLAIPQALVGGGGGLTKIGAGTLTVSGGYSYTGNTTVGAGTLSLAAASLADNSTVGIASGAVLNLPHGATDQVAGLILGGVSQPAGTYSSSTPGGFITGSGSLLVTGSGGSPYDTWISGFPSIPVDQRGPDDDPDGDGVSNALEFALGGAPDDGGSLPRVYTLIADSSADANALPELLMTIAVRAGTPAFAGGPSPTASRDGFLYSIGGSLTLNGFPAVVTPVNLVAPPAPNATPPAGYEYRTFSLNGSDGLPDRGFLRVEVTPSP